MSGHPEFLREDADAKRPAHEQGDRIDSAARAAMAALVLLAVVDVASLVNGLSEIRLLGRIADGETVSDAAVSASDTRSQVLGLLQMLCWIAAAATFIFWFQRAYKAVDTVAPGFRRHGTGWAIGGWFVPILALWRPKQIANDIWRATAPPGKEGVGYLTVWWTFFLISNIVSRAALRSYGEGDTPAEIRNGSIVYAVSDAIEIIGLVLALFVVRLLTRRMTGRLDATAGAPAAGSVDLIKRA